MPTPIRRVEKEIDTFLYRLLSLSRPSIIIRGSGITRALIEAARQPVVMHREV